MVFTAFTALVQAQWLLLRGQFHDDGGQHKQQRLLKKQARKQQKAARKAAKRDRRPFRKDEASTQSSTANGGPQSSRESVAAFGSEGAAWAHAAAALTAAKASEDDSAGIFNWKPSEARRDGRLSQ
ncbi:hypothetical protein BBJ28_00013333, partial [Nothophytophthora sp. Chile5]